MKRFFVGGKGGGGDSGGGASQVRTPDNLRSTDTVELILGISEGRILGLTRGTKSFYIGGTQLENENGESNFQDFTLHFFDGQALPSYKIKPVLGGLARSTQVNVSLSSASPVVRETQSGQIDFIDVRLVVNQLYYQSSSGIYESDLEYSIEYKATSSLTWKDVYTDHVIKIHGKTTSPYAKEHRFAVPRINEPYEVRVTKVSAESDTTFARDVSWESFQEVISGNYTFENTAVVQVVGQSSNQISSMPEFEGDYDLRIVKIPSNYDPILRTYDGVWDGTFKEGWTNNPAWCVYDMVMNDRFGINAYYPVVLDKYDCYEAAQWCDDNVPDGYGGTRRRFTMNLLVADARASRDLVRFMAGTFNAVMVDDQDGTARLFVEKDDSALHIFAKENIIGDFQYSYTDVTVRYNDINVSFTNPDLNWVEDRRRVVDQDDIDLNGRVTTDFIAVGCTNAAEAIYRARYKLISGLTEYTSVMFKTNRRGLIVQPLEIMLICDPDMGWGISGRVKQIAEDLGSVTLRDPVYLEVGIEYTFRCNVIDVAGGVKIIEATIVPGSTGSVITLTFTEALPDENYPDRMQFEIGSNTNGFAQAFRVLTVDEEDGNPDTITITGTIVNRDKWAQLDDPEYQEDPVLTSVNDAFSIPGPTSVSFIERFDRAKMQFQLVVSPVLDTLRYRYYNGEFEVWSRPTTGGGFVKRDLVFNDTIIDHPPGQYDFKILPKTYLGTKAEILAVTAFTFTVTNPADPPDDMEFSSAQGTVAGSHLYWPPVTNIDLKGYEIRAGRSWEDFDNVVTEDFQGTSIFVAHTTKEPVSYFGRAKDVFGNYSQGVASITVSVTPPVDPTGFIAIPQGDNMMFTWQAPLELGVEMEIRRGESWGNGQFVVRSAGDRVTKLLPHTGEITFFMKAVSALGVYSNNSVFYTVIKFASQSRNIVIVQDEWADGFLGTKHNMEVVADNLLLTAGTTSGRYYFEVDLPETYLARNWVDDHMIATPVDELTWDDAEFTWDDPEADAPWAVTGEVGNATLGFRISKWVGLPTGADDLIKLNSSTDSQEGVTASPAIGTAYGDAYYLKGLATGPFSRHGWAISLGSTFFIPFEVKLDAEPEDGAVLLTLTGASISLALEYDAVLGGFYLLGSDGSRVDAPPIDLTFPAFLIFGIDQAGGTRSLYVATKDQATDSVVEGSETYAPLGSMTKISAYDATF